MSGPGVEFRQKFWLHAGFGVNGSSALPLKTPAPGLGNAPQHQIEGSGARLESMQSVASERLDADFIHISSAASERTIVRFENVAPVAIFDQE